MRLAGSGMVPPVVWPAVLPVVVPVVVPVVAPPPPQVSLVPAPQGCNVIPSEVIPACSNPSASLVYKALTELPSEPVFHGGGEYSNTAMGCSLFDVAGKALEFFCSSQ